MMQARGYHHKDGMTAWVVQDLPVGAEWKMSEQVQSRIEIILATGYQNLAQREGKDFDFDGFLVRLRADWESEIESEIVLRSFYVGQAQDGKEFIFPRFENATDRKDIEPQSITEVMMWCAPGGVMK